MKESLSHQILALNILREDLTGPAGITVYPGVRRAGSVMGSSQLNFGWCWGGAISQKKRNGCLGLTNFGLLESYALPLRQAPLPPWIGGVQEPHSLRWPGASVTSLVGPLLGRLLWCSLGHLAFSWLIFFQITSASSQTLRGRVLCRTTLKDSSAYCSPEWWLQSWRGQSFPPGREVWLTGH